MAECKQICTSADTATMSLINLNLSALPSPVQLVRETPSPEAFSGELFHRQPPCLSRKIFPKPPTPRQPLFQSSRTGKGMSNESRLCACVTFCVYPLPSHPKVRNKNSIPPHFHPETKNSYQRCLFTNRANDFLLQLPIRRPPPALRPQTRAHNENL